MAKTDNLSDFITSLANTIRTKTNTTAPINPQDFETKINEMSNGDTEIFENVLQGKASVTEFKNSNITALRKYALAYMPYLKTVELPNLKTLDSYSFGSCPNLRNLYLPNISTLGSNCFQNCTSLIEMVFTTTITTALSCFSSCTKLKKVDFANLSSSIATKMFQGCSAFDTLIIRKTASVVALTNVHAFTGTLVESGTGYVYVPSTLVESYKTATNWVTYANQIRAIEDYPEITGG